MFALTFSTVYKQPDEYMPPETAALAGNTQYPNLNTTDYASRPINRQLRQHKAWECVSTNLKYDNVVIATNKINGREWNSTIWGYEQVEDCSEEAAVFKVQCDALTTCMEYATWNTFIVALHSGKLNIWSTFAQVRNPQNPYCLFLLSSKNEHTHPISSLEVMKANSGKCITGDRNGKLLVWDLNQADIVSCLKYNFAHCGAITAIASDAAEESIFYTCSADKSVLLWDIRETRPAKALFDDFDFAFKHLAISPVDSNILLAGDQLGQILTLDKRMPNTFLGLQQIMPRAIKKLVPNGSQLAVLADTKQFKVLDLHDNNKIVYDDQSAKSFLRDAAWYKDNQLLAVGYDSHLHKHQIPQ